MNISIKSKSLAEIEDIAKDIVIKNKIQKSQVVAVFDVSGSTEDFYDSGIIDGLATRILALGLQLDDDGEIPLYAFDDKVYRLKNLNKNNIERCMLELKNVGGGWTNYYPVLDKVINDAKKGDPMLVLFFTDGETDNQEKIKKLLIKSSRLPIFFQFYGIYEKRYKPRFGFLEELDSMNGRVIDNCGFSELQLSINQDNKNSDEEDKELYEDMLKEYKDFPMKARARGVEWENRRKFLGIF